MATSPPISLVRGPELFEKSQAIAKIGGWELDLETRFLQWTSETYRIHEVTPETYTPTVETAIDFYIGQSRLLIREELERAIREKGVFDLELQLRTAGQNLLWVRAQGQTEQLHGKTRRIYGILQDITEKRKLEQQLLRGQRLESIGTLAGGLAHDLNNLLVPIYLSCDLLHMHPRDDEDKSLIDGIQHCAQRGSDLVKHIMSFARGQSGPFHPVELPLLLKSLEPLLRQLLPTQVELNVHLDPDLKPAWGDRTEIEQVLMNLCINASEAMPDGGRLNLRASMAEHPQHSGSSCVLLEVEDTGTGIPEEVGEKMFDPFFTTKELGGGTGLGLPTVDAIVRRHQGFLDYRSVPGCGTVFQVHLPCAPLDVQISPSSPLEIKQRENHGITALVVEDENGIRNILCSSLRHRGFNVVEARNGEEALFLYRENPTGIHLVITDLMMPQMDGCTLARHLKELSPKLPIIGTSGLADTENMTEIKESGIRHLLAKPYTLQSLFNKVNEILDGN
ncbi:MAG: response regulator [Blastochloris sp.]|nr:response regulator [Blastochloris sp.]